MGRKWWWGDGLGKFDNKGSFAEESFDNYLIEPNLLSTN